MRNITSNNHNSVNGWLINMTCRVQIIIMLEKVAIIAMYCHLRPPDATAIET